MKKKKNTADDRRLYLGVDIGGTKVQASLVRESGEIIGRQKRATPRDVGPEGEGAAIEKCMDDMMRQAGIQPNQLTAVGVAVPGVIDPKQGLVVVAPNMQLTGVAIGPLLEARFQVPIVLGNDGNLGALGETWLGSARKARSALYICVGTGIGSGLVLRGKLWRGDRESAGEIGHLLVQIDGPKCGCGNRGCLEALASRTAIERDIRQGLAEGRPSALTELAQGDLTVIRSRLIRKALEAEDQLVAGVVRRAAEVLGYACVNVRHLIDPEVIVLGGGLIEACSDFVMPIVENIVGRDPLPGAREGGRVLLSALGDDAVVLGAVAAARQLVGRSPFKKRFQVQPKYPAISRASKGEITIGRETFRRDVYICVNGQVKKRGDDLTKGQHGAECAVSPSELEKICRGGPEVFFLGAGKKARLELSEGAKRFLAQRAIRCEILPTAQAIERYNRSKRRKAALFHVSG